MSIESIKTKLYTTNEYDYVYQDVNSKLAPEDIAVLKQKYKLRDEYQGPGYSQPIHSMCLNCQARHFIKYDHHPENETSDTFGVKCEFVPGGLPPGSKQVIDDYQTKKGISQKRAMLLLRSTIDPVAWCQLMFGFDERPEWRIRSYQKEMLRCSAHKYVIRAGRRIGKTFGIVLKLIYLLFNTSMEAGLDAEGNEITSGPEILIITPYQAQIVMIFNEMEKILKRNRDLVKEITTGTGGSLYVKTPFFRLETKNGGKISGFVSGVGNKDDGSGGGTLRGQSAAIIYLDEMDMIPDAILEKVVMPILLTRTGVKLLISSTPIGKRSFFYNWSQNTPEFKEDYFPSTVLPQWDDQKKSIEKMYSPSSDSFKAEYMADFIEGGFGVFKPALVFGARGAFYYTDCELGSAWWQDSAGVSDPNRLIITMGIDWNKNAGTEIIIVAYDPSQNHYWVIDAVNVSAGEFTARKYMDEVIRLNYKWKPHNIYADEGYGHHIIDDLRLEAHLLKSKSIKSPLDRETVQIGERLKAFNFSKNVTLKNPIDGTDIVKNGKEFLVQNAIRVFETQRIWFPEDDADLKDQLLNYVDLGRSKSSGKPIYGPDSEKIADHRLDALMLALGGLFLEHSAYAEAQMTFSTPSMLTKQLLDKRASKFNDPLSALNVLKGLNEHGVSAQVLQIEREGVLHELGDPKVSWIPERPRSQLIPDRPLQQNTGDEGLLDRLRSLMSGGTAKRPQRTRERSIQRRSRGHT